MELDANGDSSRVQLIKTLRWIRTMGFLIRKILKMTKKNWKLIYGLFAVIPIYSQLLNLLSSFLPLKCSSFEDRTLAKEISLVVLMLRDQSAIDSA